MFKVIGICTVLGGGILAAAYGFGYIDLSFKGDVTAKGQAATTELRQDVGNAIAGQK